MKAKLLAATLVLAAAATPTLAGDPAPAWAKPYLGTWTLSGASEGGAVCGFDVLPTGAVGGVGVRMWASCRQNLPVEDVAAFTVADNGKELRLIDPLRKTVIAFRKTGDGDWMATEEVDNEGLVLMKGDPGFGDVSAKDRRTGTFLVSGPNGAHSCGYEMSSNASGSAGKARQFGRCDKRWKARPFVRWTFANRQITLYDKAGKPALVLKQDDLNTFMVESKAGEPVFFGPGAVQADGG